MQQDFKSQIVGSQCNSPKFILDSFFKCDNLFLPNFNRLILINANLNWLEGKYTLFNYREQKIILLKINRNYETSISSSRVAVMNSCGPTCYRF